MLLKLSKTTSLPRIKKWRGAGRLFIHLQVQVLRHLLKVGMAILILLYRGSLHHYYRNHEEAIVDFWLRCFWFEVGTLILIKFLIKSKVYEINCSKLSSFRVDSNSRLIILHKKGFFDFKNSLLLARILNTGTHSNYPTY